MLQATLVQGIRSDITFFRSLGHFPGARRLIKKAVQQAHGVTNKLSVRLCAPV
ncbi:MAG: hypothetical protein OJF50_003643 [Nitrospira sp.]|nr:hypothetical protein [Nitrospira sp.]